MSRPDTKLRVVSERGSRPASGDPGHQDSSRDLLQRAKIVAQQMRYFGLVARKCSFDELVPSTERASFVLVSEDRREKEARFTWNSGEPDFVFSLSYKDADKVWIIAESRADILGLVLVSHSLSPQISVGTKPWLGGDQLGPRALQFQELLLTLPDFVETPAWAIMDT